MQTRPRVLLISEVLPATGNAGSLVLARHLRDYPNVSAIVPFPTPDVLCATTPVGPGWSSRFATRRPDSRLVRLMTMIGLLSPNRRSAAARALAVFRPDVILAVAHGQTAFQANRLAQKTHVPLALMFHDWWPDFVPTRFRRLLDFRYRALYRQCDAAFCVSDELREMLGPHPRAVVLPPLPSERPPLPSAPVVTEPFELHYYGNMTGCYREPLLSLLRSLNGSDWRLQLSGSAEDWTPEDKVLASRVGGYSGYLPDERLDELRSRAGAFLVVLSFFVGDRRRVATSFPSKLVEYCQTARPIIVWGPAESAAARWAHKTGAALIVDRPDPRALIQAVTLLSKDGPRKAELVAAARLQAETTFSPLRIRRIFDDVLGNLSGMAQPKS